MLDYLIPDPKFEEITMTFRQFMDNINKIKNQFLSGFDGKDINIRFNNDNIAYVNFVLGTDGKEYVVFVTDHKGVHNGKEPLGFVINTFADVIEYFNLMASHSNAVFNTCTNNRIEGAICIERASSLHFYVSWFDLSISKLFTDPKPTIYIRSRIHVDEITVEVVKGRDK